MQEPPAMEQRKHHPAALRWHHFSEPLLEQEHSVREHGALAV